jgi:hypothetical protein
LGFGLVGGLLLSAASAQDFSYANYDGVRTACGPNGRDGSYNTGWNGARYSNSGDRYGSRYDNSRYGSNYGSWRNNDWNYGRSASSNGYGYYGDRFSRGYDSNRFTSRYDNSWNHNGYRGYDNYGYDRLSSHRGYDRW